MADRSRRFTESHRRTCIAYFPFSRMLANVEHVDGTKMRMIAELVDGVHQVMAMPETKKYLLDLNVEIMKPWESEMRVYQAEEIEKWKYIAKVAGVPPQ